METQDSYLQLLAQAGAEGGHWLCSGDGEGSCPLCGRRAQRQGEAVASDWEGEGPAVRYASWCVCGTAWVEEVTNAVSRQAAYA